MSKQIYRLVAPRCNEIGIKHCQRHNGPEGWVLLTKVTSSGLITSCYTNRDQTSSDRLSTNFKFQRNISTLTKLKLENWPILTSGFWPQLNFITKPSISSKIMTKLQLQNLAWTSTSKYWPNLETLCSKSEQKLNFMTKSPSKSAPNCCQHVSHYQHEQQ